MSTKLESLTNDFSATEKDLFDIVTKRINFETTSEFYEESLKTLIRKLIVNIAPFYDEETCRNALIYCSSSLDVKGMTDGPSPIANYIEAGIIRNDLFSYLQEHTGIRKFLEEKTAMTQFLLRQDFPLKSDNPDFTGIMNSLRYASRRIDFWRSTEEVAEELQTMLEAEFKNKTSWSADDQETTIRRLKAKQPASFTSHDWHYEIIDFIEWYCLKNNMTFYLTRDLYYSDDAETVYNDNPGKSDDCVCLIENMEGRMLMHLERYGTDNADEIIQRYAEILQAIRSTETQNNLGKKIRGRHRSDSVTVISEIAAEAAILPENCDKDYKSAGRRLYDILNRLTCSPFPKQWFISLYKEVLDITEINPAYLQEIADDLPVELEGEEPEESDKDAVVNCYLTTYPVLGEKKAQEIREDILNALKDFNENDEEKYLSETARKELYTGLKETFEKHADTETAETAAYYLFRSLMSLVDFPYTGENHAIMDAFEYKRATELVNSHNFHLHDLILDTEKNYAELIRGFGFSLNPVQINRLAEKIHHEACILRRVVENKWTKEAHEVLHDIIIDNLSNVILVRSSSFLDDAGVNAVYRAVCKEFEIAPMV